MCMSGKCFFRLARGGMRLIFNAQYDWLLYSVNCRVGESERVTQTAQRLLTSGYDANCGVCQRDFEQSEINVKFSFRMGNERKTNRDAHSLTARERPGEALELVRKICKNKPSWSVTLLYQITAVPRLFLR